MIRNVFLVLVLMAFSILSYGANDKELFDLNRHQKLQVSTVYFNSVGRGALYLGIGFDGSYWRNYLSENKSVSGSIEVYAVNAPGAIMVNPIVIELKENYLFEEIRFDQVRDMCFIVKELDLDSTGSYLIVPKIYIPKDIPNNFDSAVMVFERARCGLTCLIDKLLLQKKSIYIFKAGC